jgi:serine/threonine protein kinase
MDVEMDKTVAILGVPTGHPDIPNDISPEDIVAIVTMHSAQAPHVNRDTRYHKTNVMEHDSVVGTNIFLSRTDGQHSFTFGREQMRQTARTKRIEAQDVYLPGTKVGIRQFTLVPVWDSNCWRLQSSSETVAVVNGAPIQNYTFRTKRNPQPFPQAIYLQQTSVNSISINGQEVDIWLMKSVQDIFEPHDFTPGPLQAGIQDFTQRPEQWARNQYLMTQDQVSAKSFRVIGRFTGQILTAKVFAGEDGNYLLRDQEFSTFKKQAVDASVVRYLQTTEVDDIPAIITTTHENLASYATLQEQIRKLHPGARFAIATKLMRRLFSALEFLHFHGIIHRHVSKDSVLLSLKDGKAEDVLLVDYTTARPFIPGAPLPVEDMVADGQAAMELVEDCCDIWALRNGPTKDALGGDMMQHHTEVLLQEYNMISRVASDYFEVQGQSNKTVKGQKLERLLDAKRNAWESARAKQEHNLMRREVAMSSKSKVDACLKEWHGVHPFPGIGEKQYMILSLGHEWLDSLADQLYQKRWDTTPREVCMKFKEFGGNLEEPWQSIKIKKAIEFTRQNSGYEEQAVVVWLASCCEVYPEWRQAIERHFERQIVSQDGSISRQHIRNLSNALASQGRLPPAMETTVDELTKQNNQDHLRVEEIHPVWYHIPSRMFNLTQLQRLASPDQFVAAINGDGLRCDNFVEVRGEPKLQGCYAQLSLLGDFANQLGLTVPELPGPTPTFPIFDPSDFSQASQARIVLARTGMLGFGSIIRHGDQCDFLIPKHSAVVDPTTSKKFISPNAYIPTNFGDMKVLPNLPEGVRYHDCPEHWSKFKSAEELEVSAALQKRKILQARGPQGRGLANRAMTTTMPTATEIDKSPLVQMLKHREEVRAKARLPTKRSAEAGSTRPVTPEPKRVRGVTVDIAPPVERPNLPDITASFIERAEAGMKTPPKGQSRRDMPQPTLQTTAPAFEQLSFARRNSALLARPPRVPKDFNESFTVHDETEDLDQDWKEVDAMLAQMPDKDDGQEMRGLTAFQFNGSSQGDDSDNDTDVDRASFIDGPNGRASMGWKLQSLTTRQSQTQQAQQNLSSVFGEPTQLATQTPSQFGGRGRGSQPQAPTSTAPISFAGSTRFHLATPQTTSPATGTAQSPANSFRKSHKRGISNLSIISEFPPTEPSSPTAGEPVINAPQTSVFGNRAGIFGNAPSQPASPVRPEETRPRDGYFGDRGVMFGSPGPAMRMSPTQSFIHNGVYSNPANAINGFFDQQVQAGHEDVPDTDDEGGGSE